MFWIGVIVGIVVGILLCLAADMLSDWATGKTIIIRGEKDEDN